DGGRRHRAARGGTQRDPRQERGGTRGCRDRPRPRTGPQALHRVRRRDRGHRQGPTRRGLTPRPGSRAQGAGVEFTALTRSVAPVVVVQRIRRYAITLVTRRSNGPVLRSTFESIHCTLDPSSAAYAGRPSALSNCTTVLLKLI